MPRTYPPTLDDIKAAILDFPGLARSTDATLQMALDQALGEIGIGISGIATPSGYSDRINLSLWTLCLDLTIWRLRWRVERDSDTNDVPKALQTQRAELMQRIETFTIETPLELNRYTFGTFDPICPPDLPVNNRMF